MVLKGIEKAKNEGLFTDPCESQVNITTSSSEVIDLLKRNEKDLKEYFIVSSVNAVLDNDLTEGEEYLNGKIHINVAKADGEKCIRCWLVVKNIGSNNNHPELCERCADIVENIGQPRE